MDNKIPAKDLHSFITRYIPPPYNKKRQTAPSTLIWSSPLTPENMDIAQATVTSFNPWINNAHIGHNAASPRDGEGCKVVVTASEADPADEIQQQAYLSLSPLHLAPDEDEASMWYSVEVLVERNLDSVHDDSSIHVSKGGIDGVPTLVYHGDIDDQITNSQEVRKTLRPDKQVSLLKTHRHYRLLTKEVCMSMSRYQNAKGLICLIATCVRDHGEAYKKGMSHRDVRAGNFLIKEKIVNGQLVRIRVGLLTDWVLSKQTDAPRTARQPDRTGTWQFMSVYTLNHPSEAIGIPDELESFFYILLYFAIRFFRHNCENVTRYMHHYFDGFEGDEGEYFCGIAKRETMTAGMILVEDGEQLNFDVPPDAFADCQAGHAGIPSSSANPDISLNTTHPLNTIVDALLVIFKARYALLKNSKVVAQDTFRSAPRPAPPTDEMDAWFADLIEEEESGEEEQLFVPATDKAKTELSAEQRKDFESQAARLETHSGILRLLHMFFNNKDESIVWPHCDKIPDQLRQTQSKEDSAKPAIPQSITMPAVSQSVLIRSVGPLTRPLGLPLVPLTTSGPGTKHYNTADDVEAEVEG